MSVCAHRRLKGKKLPCITDNSIFWLVVYLFIMLFLMYYYIAFFFFFFLILVCLLWSCISSQRLGLKGLALNVTHSKTQRLNNNISVQHHHHIVRATQIENINSTQDRTVLKLNILVEIKFSLIMFFFFK